jgi:putative ABC transport system permease protein
MPVVYRASFGYLTRHPWQLALALVGICIGVAVVVAVDLANQSSSKAFLRSMETVNGAATHQIVGGTIGLDESVYASLRRTGEFRNLAPIVSGYADIRSSTVQVLGVDIFAERGFRQFSSPGNIAASIAGSTDDGSKQTVLRRMLTEPGAVLMSPRAATAQSIRVGDRFEVLANGKKRSAVLVGVFADAENSAVGTSDFLVADISTAQSWFDMPGYLTRIDVKTEPHDTTGVLDRIREFLPPGAQLLDAEGRTRSTLQMSQAFSTNLTAMSLLALLVGVFLIYNSVSFAVLQRRRLIGILRALGLTRKQVFTMILREALVLGFIGSVLGVVLGVWLGEQLLVLVSQSINDLYFRVNVTNVSTDFLTLLKGMAAGVIATLVAAMIPALEASNHQPRLAMLRSSIEVRAGRIVRAIALVGLTSAVASLLLVRISGSSLIAGLIALFMLIMGIALCIPAVMKLAADLMARVASAIGGLPAQLAVSGVAASVSRTAVAVVALAVAMSTTIGVGIMVDSFRGSVIEWLDHTLRSDVYVSVARGTMDEALVSDLVDLEGVAEFSTTRRTWIESQSGRSRLIALEVTPRTYAGTHIVAGDVDRAWQEFSSGAVLVSESYAYRHALEPGASLSLAGRDGPREFPVAGIYRSYVAGQGAVLMSFEAFSRYWDDPGVRSVGLYLHDGIDADDIIDAARVLSESRQAILLRSDQDIREISLRIFDQTFIITDVLYWLALTVAVIGILGAMLAVQIERARELATLRALGMTTGQVGTMVISQTGFIGLLSGLAAVPLGIMMAWMLIRVINRRAFGWQLDIAVSTDILVVAVVVSVAAALLAGLYPAYLATKSQPALAMREE